MEIERIKIGNSDYSREEIKRGCEIDRDGGWQIGSSFEEFMDRFEEFEKLGYKIKFETSIFRKIFGMGIYKIVAVKEKN